MLAYANCRMLTNVLWEPSFKLEMFVSSFHQFCLLVISWICLTSGSSSAWVVGMTHTHPSLGTGDFPCSLGRCFLLPWWGKSLTSHPEQHSQAAGESQNYQGLWSSAQCGGPVCLESSNCSLWRRSQPTRKNYFILADVFSPAPFCEIS